MNDLTPVTQDIKAAFDTRETRTKRPDVGDVDTQQVLFVNAEGELLVEAEGYLVAAHSVDGFLGTMGVGETALEFLKPRRARLLRLLKRAVEVVR